MRSKPPSSTKAFSRDSKTPSMIRERSQQISPYAKNLRERHSLASSASNSKTSILSEEDSQKQFLTDGIHRAGNSIDGESPRQEIFEESENENSMPDENQYYAEEVDEAYHPAEAKTTDTFMITAVLITILIGTIIVLKMYVCNGKDKDEHLYTTDHEGHKILKEQKKANDSLMYVGAIGGAIVAVAIIVALSVYFCCCDQPDDVVHEYSGPAAGYKCGGAVDPKANSCQDNLFTPTNQEKGKENMHCYGYGGPNDPCAIHQNNDKPDDGMSKDPSKCTGDTFYLWDEPDTQGQDYEWAATQWKAYVDKWSDQVATFRKNGGHFTTPLLRAPDLAKNAKTFLDTCGTGCTDPSSKYYIGIIAVNVFATGTSEDDCKGGAQWTVNAVKEIPQTKTMPVYVTNWAVGAGKNPSKDDQINAMKAIKYFFKPEAPDSPIQRVYWFGATSYEDGSDEPKDSNNNLTLDDLGDKWEYYCNLLMNNDSADDS